MSDPQNETGSSLNDRQAAFVAFYLKNPNATNAARLAGYSGDMATLGQVGYENLKKPEIQAEIARLRKERRLTPDAVLDLIETQATADISPYVHEDGTIDVQGLASAGLGQLVIGAKPGRNGPEITLSSPQTAQKILARHHKLIGPQVEIDQSTTVQLEKEQLGALVDQLAAAAQHIHTEKDDTE